MTPRPHTLHVGSLARAELGRALGAVEDGWRFHRAHGARYRRARALCSTADAIDVRRPHDWQRRAERLYRRAARDLDAIAGADGAGGPGSVLGSVRDSVRGSVHGSEAVAAQQAQRALVAASRPYRRMAIALGALAVAAAVAVALLLLLGCLASPALRARVFPRDLAAGRPWLASSAIPPVHRGGVGPSTRKGDFFFQTFPSDHPWIDVDLGTPQVIRSLLVENRRDCCWERALPLDVEVLDLETQKWRRVAQRRSGFHVWTHEIGPLRARHVRFRLAGVGVLHLRRISLYEW